MPAKACDPPYCDDPQVKSNEVHNPQFARSLLPNESLELFRTSAPLPLWKTTSRSLRGKNSR